MTTDTTAASKDDLRQILNQIVHLAKHARGLLNTEAGPGGKMSARDAARVAKVGEIAYLHERAMDKGPLTLAESRQLRSDHGGAEMRSTANLFGRRNSNALFYRAVPVGTPVKGDQEVRLTEEGKRIAGLYQKVQALDESSGDDSDKTP